MEKEKENKKNYRFTLTSSFGYRKQDIKKRLVNTLNMKKKYNSRIVAGIIILILVFSTSIIALIDKQSFSFLENLFQGEKAILVTNPKEYGGFKSLKGYRSFRIFPSDISDSEAEEYYYSFENTLFDPTCQIYLTCSYDKETYEAELQRLSKISNNYQNQVKSVIYDTDNFFYPAYVTINANNHCYEYALLLGDNKIAYIFLGFIPVDNVVFDLKYLPKNYENKANDETVGFTIYKYYKENGDGIWIETN